MNSMRRIQRQVSEHHAKMKIKKDKTNHNRYFFLKDPPFRGEGRGGDQTPENKCPELTYHYETTNHHRKRNKNNRHTDNESIITEIKSKLTGHNINTPNVIKFAVTLRGAGKWHAVN